MAAVGAPFDTVRASVKGAVARAWVAKFNLQPTASFALRKWGERAARALADVWCSRMQRLYDLYTGADDPTFVYDADSLTLAEVPGALLDEVNASAKPGSEEMTTVRCAEIAGIVPR